MADALRQLDDIVGWGVVHDVFDAEEASAVLTLIGRHAAIINEATFGAFFGSLQRILGRSLLLAVARMYETEKAYALRSLPAAFKHLRTYGHQLKVNDREVIRLAFLKLGESISVIAAADDLVVTATLADAFEKRFVVLQSKAGNAVKTLRDKIIAHHELIDVTTLPTATYAEIDELIEFAKEFIGVIGAAYTNVAYRAGDGRFFLSLDAERSTLCLKRLLSAAGVSVSGEGPADEV